MKSARSVDYQLSGDISEALNQIVTHVLEGSNDKQVVIGPLVHPPLGDLRSNGMDYFMLIGIA